jgi:hypothetical protein
MGLYSLSWDNPADHGLMAEIAGDAADRRRWADEAAAQVAAQEAADLHAAQTGDGACASLARWVASPYCYGPTADPKLPREASPPCGVTRKEMVFALARRLGYLDADMAARCVDKALSGRSWTHAMHPSSASEFRGALERVENHGLTLAEIAANAEKDAAEQAAREEVAAFRGADNRFAALSTWRK